MNISASIIAVGTNKHFFVDAIKHYHLMKYTRSVHFHDFLSFLIPFMAKNDVFLCCVQDLSVLNQHFKRN